MKLRYLLPIVTALATTSAALATGSILSIITKNDQQRLDKYGEVRKAGIAEARAGGSPEEVKILDAILAKPLKSFKGLDLTGNWQCRTTKVGGLLPLVTYGWFKCKVTDDGSGWRLQKITGSQRTTGTFFDDGDKRMIYLGAGSVNDDKPKKYGSGPDSDQVGYAFRTGQKEWRIEFPAPYYESKLDIMEFKR